MFSLKILVSALSVLLASLWAIGLLLGWPIFSMVTVSLVLIALGALVVIGQHLISIKRSRAFERELKGQAMAGTSSSMAEMVEQFGKNLSAMTNSQFGHRGLTDLPFYMVLGAPGSGKSTALQESGLTFPSVGQNQRSFKGIGGTRNCDWWVTEQGVFLDTAGRYTTESEDRREWFAFLDLLKKHRGDKPINGVVLTVSVPDLIKKDAAGVEGYAQLLRERIDELSRRLDVCFPIYVLFTKCDMISGFKDVFADLVGSDRTQVFGSTLAWPPPSDVDYASAFANETGRVMPAVQVRRLYALNTERDAERQLKAMRFPMQFSTVGKWMSDLIIALCRPSATQERPGLRGFYFTSAVQPGHRQDEAGEAAAGATSADVKDGADGGSEQEAQAAKARQDFEASIFLVPGAPGGSAARAGDKQERCNGIFLRSVFAHVILPERDLVRYSARRQRQQDIVRLLARIGSPVLGLLLVIWVIAAYVSSIGLVAQAEAAVVDLGRALEAEKPDLGQRLAAMDRLRASLIALEREDHVGLGGFRAKVAAEYYRQVDEMFAMPAAHRLADLLDATLAQPDTDLDTSELLYDLLRAYQMLGGKGEGFEADLLQRLLEDGAWTAGLTGDGTVLPDRHKRSAEEHLAYLVAHPEDVALWQVEVRDPLIVRVSRQLADAMWLPNSYEDIVATQEKSLPAISGTSLFGDDSFLRSAYSFPGIYSQQGWDPLIGPRVTGAAERLSERLGRLGVAKSASAIATFMHDRFVTTTREHWERLLRELTLAPAHDLRDALRKLRAFTDTNSAYKQVLAEIFTGHDVHVGSGEGPGHDDLEWFQDVAAAFVELEQALQVFIGSTEYGKRSVEVARLRALAQAFESTRQRAASASKAVRSHGLQKAMQTSLDNVLKAVFLGLSQEIRDEQDRQWKLEVSDYVTEHFPERYPFAGDEGIKAEVPLADFSAFFNPRSGVVWARVEQIRELQTIKALGLVLLPVTSAYDRMVGRSEKIRDACFDKGGEKLWVQFTATLIQRQGIKDIALTIGQENFTYNERLSRTNEFTWFPGGSNMAQLSVAIVTDRWLRKTYDTPWGLVRLLRAASNVGEAEPAGRRLTWDFASQDVGKTFHGAVDLQSKGLEAIIDDRKFFSDFQCPEAVSR
ncbi:MAG: type VI secretion system membrane subunit TssM [Planctomycetota bacterium]